MLQACDSGNPVREPDGDDDRSDYFSSPALVQDSAAIVTGRVIGERDESFEFKSSTSGEVVATLTERVMTVEVSSVLTGPTDLAGTRIAVLQTVASARVGRGGEDRGQFSPLEMPKDQTMVFFLTPAALPPESKGPETSVWARPGEPGFAKLNGDALEFVASERYQSKARSLGYSSLEEAPGFRITLTELMNSLSD